MTWTRTVRRAAPRLLTILVLVLLSLPASASAAGWAGIAPVTGDPGGGRSISQPKIATDPAGNQAVMWIEGPSPFKIVAAFRPTGGAWGAAQVLNSGSSTAVSDIAADGAGNFIVVYGHSNGAIQQAFSNYLASGTTTFGAQQLAGSFTSTQVPLSVAVAMDGSGRAYVVAGLQGAADFAASRPAGVSASWSSISTGLSGTQSSAVDIAVTSAGEATVAERPNGASPLRVFRLPTGGTTWNTVTAPGAANGGTPVVAVDDQGRVTILYLVAVTNTQIAAQECPAGATPAPCNARTVFGPADINTNANGPTLAINPATGDAAAAWAECKAGVCDVLTSSRSGSAGAWTTPTTKIGAGNGPSMAYDSTGGLMTVWEQTTGLIHFRYPNLAAAPTLLSAANETWQSPTIAADGNGNMYGVWAGFQSPGVQSAVYDAQPPVITAASAGTTIATVGDTIPFTASANDTWTAVTYAWDFGDGTTDGTQNPTHSYSTPGTYTARMTATDGAGNSSSQTQPITVNDAQVTPPPPVGLTRPVAGQTVNLEPVSGNVTVKVPGSTKFVPLVSPTQVQQGSIVDASGGRVRITIDNGLGGLDSAEFYGGIFKFTQPKLKPGALWFANLYLFGGSFNGCPRAPRHPKIAALSRKRLSPKRSIRHLWGSGSGAFRTVGRYSSATVRGTTWLTDDKCNGTLTRVTAGKVGVRDFVLKKTIVVNKGKSYFARARTKK